VRTCATAKATPGWCAEPGALYAGPGWARDTR
jgi:hypothetical protein